MDIDAIDGGKLKLETRKEGQGDVFGYRFGWEMEAGRYTCLLDYRINDDVLVFIFLTEPFVLFYFLCRA